MKHRSIFMSEDQSSKKDTLAAEIISEANIDIKK